MISRRAVLVLLAISFALCDAAARATEFPDMVRDLNSLQNRMVLGDAKAQPLVARQFDLVEQVIASSDPEIWSDEKNIRAAAIYLLCGGAPAKLREFYEAGFVPAELAPLLDASLNYAEGQADIATKLLLGLDAKRYPPVLGGHLALVQGGSIATVDKTRAAALFDLARLMMPASLVEEAALRREIAVLDPLQDSDKLGLIANRYVSKYLDSPYAQNFWTQLRAIVLDASKKSDPALLAIFESALEKASAKDRSDVYLELARRDLLEGRLKAASDRLDKAARGTTAPEMEKRIAAYRAAVQTLSEDGGSGRAALSEFDASALKSEDVEALKIVRAVLARLNASDGATVSTREADSTVSANEEPAILLSAREALARSEALLQRASRR